MMRRHVLTFAFTEIFAYAYHRSIHFTDAHERHHLQPENMWELSNVSLLSGTFVVTFSYLLRTGWIPIVYWSAITSAHPILHHYKFHLWPMSYVQRRHDIHHANGNVNYGPVTPFMDMICGTEAAD